MFGCYRARGLPLVPGIRELTHVGSVRVHHEDLVLAIGAGPERHEKDLASVRRL